MTVDEYRALDKVSARLYMETTYVFERNWNAIGFHGRAAYCAKYPFSSRRAEVMREAIDICHNAHSRGTESKCPIVRDVENFAADYVRKVA